MRAALLILALILGPVPVLAQDGEPPAPAEGEGGGGQGGEEGGGEEGGDAKPDRKAEKKAEREARQARQAESGVLLDAVRAVLHTTQARVLEDGRLELRYDFKESTELEDWQLAGFDRAEEGRKGRAGRRGGERGQNLALGVSSNQQGLLRHRLKLVGDFEVAFKVRVLRSTGESDLVVGVGKAGARYGTQLVEGRSRGFKPVDRRSAVDRDPFNGGKAVTVTLTREGGVVRVTTGTAPAQSSDDLSQEAEGQVFLFATDMHLVLDEVVIRALVDAEDVNALAFD